MNSVLGSMKSEDTIPKKYLQSYYGKEYNGCVWLSVCHILYYMDREQSELLVNEYLKSPKVFNMLRIFSGKGKMEQSLYGRMNLIRGCMYCVHHVKFDQKKESLSNHILNTRKGGYFVVVLCENYNGMTHTVGINCYQRKMYDPMESRIMSLNEDSLSKACGDGRTFKRIAVVGELYKYLASWSNT